jgi:hypothetical protein
MQTMKEFWCGFKSSYPSTAGQWGEVFGIIFAVLGGMVLFVGGCYILQAIYGV